MISKHRRLSIGLCILTAMTCVANAQEKIISTFNAGNVILPSSQYTPDRQYEAWVWVYNKGERYTDAQYNTIHGTPDTDNNGRQWYESDYELTGGEIKWTKGTSPFSSDEYYKEHQSCRWVTSDIMGEIYMRRTFTLNAPIDSPVFMAVGHDDAPSEWYINGVQVHTVSDGWENEAYTLLTDEQKALIKTDGSENIIAVHVHQNWGGAFADCGLYAADVTTEHAILPTATDASSWDCLYYTLNYNSDLPRAEAAKWYALTEDERDWVKGVGPFSNDENMFLITEWGSQVRPILIRRHFTLTADDVSTLKAGTLKLLCSYDENPTVYLNGTKIWTASGWNDNNYAEQVIPAAYKSLLREGDNVLAVSLKQGNGGGHIDYGLKLVEPYKPTGIVPTGASTDAKNADNKVYDTTGRMVGTSTHGLAKGIYITNGKKTIVR